MFVGRQDFQIKHMGYRIELPEIEYQVLAIEEIANACVLYHKEKKEITVFYETTGAELTPAAIRRSLSQIFPKYMLPTAFHQMAELPRNPNGKIDRNGLSMQLESLG
jgi:acyl-coenzyme A synthetase/AMP-(fatty) acid ligase